MNGPRTRGDDRLAGGFLRVLAALNRLIIYGVVAVITAWALFLVFWLGVIAFG